MSPMNNPMMQMLSMLRGGMNPSAVLNSLAKTDPGVAQMLMMFNGKSADQLRQMAQNMAAERGTTVEDIARQIGIQIPSQR